MKDFDLTKTTPVNWLMGSALMISRSAIEKIGMMDEKLFLYMSEVDWAQRFWENGYTVIYYPSAKLYHYHKRESKGRFGVLDVLFKRETRWHITDAIYYFKKHGIFRPNIVVQSAQFQVKV
jgi:GT2 family glycosyltransferase